MAYQVPVQWKHGDIPTAAQMNRYSDGLNAIKNKWGNSALNFAVALRMNLQYSYSPHFTATDTPLLFIHKLRYLHYGGSGNLASLDGTQSSALSAPSGGGVGVYDLDNANWLAYGMLYFVTGADFCAEDTTG